MYTKCWGYQKVWGPRVGVFCEEKNSGLVVGGILARKTFISRVGGILPQKIIPGSGGGWGVFLPNEKNIRG